MLEGTDLASASHLFGLFEPDHMRYEADRSADPAGEPSLAEMTRAAITMLERKGSGYVLLIEAGRIDHAHHGGNARRALEDTVALDEAVAAAMAMTQRDDTLMIVTADHSHPFAISGYSDRGNPTLGCAAGGGRRCGRKTAKPILPLGMPTVPQT